MGPVEAAEAVREVGLRYSSDKKPGFSRKHLKNSEVFLDAKGEVIRDAKTIARIQALVIPPAWKNVWICPTKDGYLQATGRDAKGRKQFLYHPEWLAFRDASKFSRLLAFGKSLPNIRRAVQRDLGLHGLPKEKVLAVVVRLLERSRIRIGNHQYATENATFGLTTLENRHVQIASKQISFSFKGKSGKFHEVELQDARLAKIVKRCQELPGQHLFEYLDSNNTVQDISSDDVNRYIRKASKGNFTAKDFRTWAATVEAVRLIRELENPSNRAINAVIKEVSRMLGNTPAVCRRSYIHPSALCLDGSPKWLTRPIKENAKDLLDPVERLVLRYVLVDLELK